MPHFQEDFASLQCRRLKFITNNSSGELRVRNKQLFALSVLTLAISQAIYAQEVQEPVATGQVNSQAEQGTQSAEVSGVKPRTKNAEENLQLKEMVVSAAADIPVQQRTELGKLTVYTPVSGAVVNREELDQLQLVNNLLELGKRVPGISMVRNMRIPDGGKQYTETRVDGMRAIALNTSGLDGVDLNSIDRLDVITGPGSALYGTGALGGTISVTSRQPPEKFAAKLSQEAGSFGLLRTQGNAGKTTDDGRFGFIVTGSKMDNGGWRKSYTAAANQDAAAEHKQGEGVKAFFRPFETTKITFGYDQLHYDYRWAGTLAMTKFNQDWRQVAAGTYGQAIDDYKTSQVRLQQFVGDRGEFSLMYGKIVDNFTNYGSAGSGVANNVICDSGGALGVLTAGTTVNCRSVNANAAAVTNTLKAGTNTSTTTTAMYRHEFDLAKSTLHVGIDKYQTVADTATYANAFKALQAQSGAWAQGAMTATGQGSVTVRDESTPFLHMEFSPVDKLRFHVGERFSTITDTVNDRTIANKDVVMTNKGNVIRTGATYEFNQDHLIWGNFGQTMNPAATTTMLDTAAKGTAGNTIGAKLNTERGITREVGLRGKFDRAGFQYDVTYYEGVTNGFVVARTCTAAEALALNNNVTCNVNENAGKINLSGLESMLGYAVNSWLDVGATYTNARVWWGNYKTAAVNYTGLSYQAMPKEKLNLRIAFKPAPGWKVELEADHMTAYWTDTLNTTSYKRPDLFNLRASYRSKEWSFWAQALNITNQKYATRVGQSTIAGVVVAQAASAGQGNSGSYTPIGLRVGASYNF
jgi:outer membrane receptor protein involved in Fe transport